MRKLKLEELNRLSVEEFKKTGKIRVSILLDNVRSMHNVGSAFRTADAFLVEKLYLCGITATPPHRDIRRSALGAEESVDFEYSNEAIPIISGLRTRGYEIVSVEQTDKSISLDELTISPDKRYLLVFGNEVEGVDDLIISESDYAVEIPQYGSKHSLNISVSMGIVLWEFAKVLNG